MSEKETEEIEGPAGKFSVVVYRSRNSSLRQPWVFSIRDPEGNLDQGFSRSKRGALRTIRRKVAKSEALLLHKNRARIEREKAIGQLQEAGLSETTISAITRGTMVACSLVRPGEIIVSYLSRGFNGDEWRAALFLDGEEKTSVYGKSRRDAERNVRKKLQEIYRYEALRALGPEHAPD